MRSAARRPADGETTVDALERKALDAGLLAEIRALGAEPGPPLRFDDWPAEASVFVAGSFAPARNR